LVGLEPLEDRRLLAFTVNHTPYLQLGNASLDGFNGGADQAEVIWQTTGTQDTDAFTAEVRETGTVPWTNVALNAQIVTGVGGRVNHSATLGGLNFDDDYDYLITHLRGGNPIATYNGTFHTRLEANDSGAFTFVTYGDSASGDPPTNFIAVQNRINALDPAFSLLLGDNVYSSGTHAEYDLRLDPTKNAALTTYNKNHIDYFGFGNHDVGYNSGQAARENYSMPIPVQGVTSPVPLAFDADVQEEENYSYDYGGVHFVTFDTNNWQNTAALDKQLNWAVADIAAAQARATPPNWIIVFGHHPITSLGGHTEHTPDDYYYDQVLARLGPGGVGADLLLFGHAHNYQRSYPLTGHVGSTATYVLDPDDNYAKGAGLPLVVQGTGGVGLGYGASDATFSGSYLAKAMDSNTSIAAQFGFGKVDVTPSTLTYSYVNTLGQVLDSFTIGPPPPDTTPPTAALSVPLDNSLADQNPATNQVTTSAVQANLQIALADAGDGVDDASVVAGAVSFTRNSVLLVEGIDYTFAYNPGTNVITLTPLAPVGAGFGNGTYGILLSAAIEDLAGNPLSPTLLSVVVNTGLPTIVSFQDGVNGYAGTLDTYVHEDEAATTHGTNVKVYSDGDDDLGTAETQAQEAQGLVRFNNLFQSGGGASRIGGPIPDGATIASASLRVRTGTASGDISASEFRFHRMIATWDENATWDGMSTSGGGIARDGTEAAASATAIASGGNVNVAGGLVTVDVTADVQLWSSNNALSTRGWLVHPDSVALGGNTVSGQTDGWWFDSSETTTIANRPMLVVAYSVAASSTVSGRRIFYNNSIWDNPSFGFNNASAIAPDKSAYIPGGFPTGTLTVGVQNVTSYTRGINGIMVELTGTHGTLTAADFTVKMSGQNLAADNAPSGWAAAPSFTLTELANTPTSGTTRYELVWPDGAIVDQYLSVTTLANANTGLAAPDTFYFGNRVGDAFTSYPGFFNTDATDALEARGNQSPFVGITNPYDFDRDAVVNASDELAARFDQNFMAALVLSNPPAAPQSADEPSGADADFARSAVVSALAGRGVNADERTSGAAPARFADSRETTARPAAAAAHDYTSGPGESHVADDTDSDPADETLDDQLLDLLAPQVFGRASRLA
jgi:hypothetical protein